jgi:hypothetical protein
MEAVLRKDETREQQKQLATIYIRLKGFAEGAGDENPKQSTRSASKSDTSAITPKKVMADGTPHQERATGLSFVALPLLTNSNGRRNSASQGECSHSCHNAITFTSLF